MRISCSMKFFDSCLCKTTLTVWLTQFLTVLKPVCIALASFQPAFSCQNFLLLLESFREFDLFSWNRNYVVAFELLYWFPNLRQLITKRQDTFRVAFVFHRLQHGAFLTQSFFSHSCRSTFLCFSILLLRLATSLIKFWFLFLKKKWQEWDSNPRIRRNWGLNAAP